MSHPPLHLTARDFDAYAAEKATSKAYSRPRLEVKQRALAWARGVVARLAELGIAVDVHGSDEHPSHRNKNRVECQWVFFWRDPAARDELDRLLDRGRSIADVIDDPSPYTRHAFLALRLDARAVEVCFAVHPEAQVDVDNLRARLADGEGALAGELIAALTALPDEFAIGVAEGDRLATQSATPEAIRSMIERAAAGQVPLWIGWSVTRETAIEHSAILDEQLEDALIALAPIYRLVAWSRENDRIAVGRRIETAEQERARAHAEAEAQTERWRAEQAEARRRSLEQARPRAEVGPQHGGPRRPPPRADHDGGAPRPGAQARSASRRPSLDTLFSPKAGHDGAASGPEPARARDASPGPRAPSEPHRDGAASGTRPSRAAEPPQARAAAEPPREAADPAEGSPRPPAPSAPAVIEKGTRVRVLVGPFADKLGVVGELDGRGGARVLLGLLSTRLDVTALEPAVEGRERPALQSSHRRPLPPAPRKAR